MRARDNPFVTERVHRIRYQFDGLTWDGFFERLAEMNYRGAIVGPEGSGKTTLLEDLELRLRQRRFTVLFLRLTQEQPRFSPDVRHVLAEKLNPETILLFDGAEQMSWWAWRSFVWRARRAGGLIISAHQEGLLPTLLKCRTNTELLAKIIRELLGDEVNFRDVDRLFHQHRGNVRDALRDLYDRYAAGSPGCLAKQNLDQRSWFSKKTLV